MNAITPDSVLAALARHIGKTNGVHVNELVREITTVMFPDRAAERALRSVVTELRLSGHHICAHPSTGYFMAESAADLDATCEYLMDRAMASLTQISRMKNISLPDLRGQLKLPT